MVKSNELRIGNIIEFPFIGGNVEVIGVALRVDNVLFIQSKLTTSTFFELPEKYKPIPITEEWLLKFGFDKIENGTYLNKFYVTIVSGYCVFWITDTYSVAIKYVHQLQNIYFALTGEELVFLQ